MRYVFGDCILDTQRYELRRAGTRIALRPKVFQVLAYLLAHRERLVPKQELLAQVWPGQFISEATLNSCIMAVRKALGDGGRTSHCLQTVHGQGYRFVAPVEEQAHLRADEASAVAPSTAGAPHTLAPHGATHQEGTFLFPLLVNADTLDGEHKQVTVLCCALVEAPQLAARLGPEAMHHLMRDVLALAQATVQRYDGTLTHASGDGFLALFGAPVAQEDHARRAVLAALELHQRLRAPDVVRGQPPGVTLALRLGLHTGPVVAGPLAHDPQRPYTAVGDTLALAAQLQHHATPDTILISAATHALVQDEVQSVTWGTLASDASAAPVVVYAVGGITQRRAGVPRRGARPLSRFVGRARDLALLHERLEQVAGGQGQVIGIAGEPGLGKSRLLAEFARSLDGQPVMYCEGQCLAYGSTTPYLLVLALLRQRCGITEGDSSVVITAKVQQALREVDSAPEEGAPVLLRLLDIPVEMALLAPLSLAALKARTFALLRRLSLHHGQPCVLVVENLHWIDPTSEEWLTSLVEQVAGATLLLLVTYRPGYRPPWIAHSAATQLALSQLTPRDSLAVVQSVPQAAQLPASLHQAIVAKATGNPFFLEELTWAAVERGSQAPNQPGPDTIQAPTPFRPC